MVSTTPVPGGTMLGLHNLAIVMPQFIVSSNALDMSAFINTTIGRTGHKCNI